MIDDALLLIISLASHSPGKWSVSCGAAAAGTEDHCLESALIERSERRSAHTDFIAEYAVDCKDTGGIHGLRVGFFDLMPSIGRIVVHYSLDSVTGAAILRPARPVLDLGETQPVL